MWPVTLASGSMKESAGMVSDAGLFPFAGKNVDELICEGMDMRRYSDARVELAQDRHAACCFVLVENEQLDTGVRPRLPLFVLCQSCVLKHGSMKARAWEYLQVFCRSTTYRTSHADVPRKNPGRLDIEGAGEFARRAGGLRA